MDKYLYTVGASAPLDPPSKDEINVIRALESSLQAYREGGMMNTAEAAELSNMIHSKKEKLVLRIHKNKISQRKDGIHKGNYCYTNIRTANGSKKVSGQYHDLIDKLYAFYYGERPKSELSLSDIRDEYEAWYRIGRKPATLQVDQKAFLHIQKEKIAHIPIVKIDYQAVRSFFVGFSKDHAGEYTKSMYDKLRSCIYNMLDYALEEDIIQNRVEKYHFQKNVSVCFKQSDPRETWSDEERTKLLQYLEKQTDVFSMLFEYQLLTGDRFETASVIRPEDVDENTLRIFIHAHQILADREDEGYWKVVEGTKGNSSKGRRWLPITQTTLRVVQRAIEAMDDNAEYIFEFRGQPIRANTYRPRVKKICEQVGVPYHNPHAARSYAASAMNTGDNITELCDYFGWSDKKMPLRYNRDIASGAKIRKKLSVLADFGDIAPVCTS